MKRILTRLLAVCLCAALLAGCGGAGRWKEQYDLGMRYLSEENYQEAILAFTEAIGVDPNQAELYIRRAGAYVYSGETADNLAAALADYEVARELDSADPDLWLGLADVYIRQGDYEKAKEVLEEGLEATGGDERIQSKLDQIEMGMIADSQGKRRRRNSYDENGVLSWYHVWTYDEQGRESGITHYDAAGNELGHVDVLYNDQGQKIQDYMMSATPGTLTRVECEYDASGNLTQTKDYSLDDGRMLSETKIFYDEAGREIRREHYDENGESVGTAEYIRDEQTGLLLIQNDYRSDGSFSGSIEYEYNEQGMMTRSVSKDEDGNIQGYWVYGENGTMTAYDKDGNVLYSKSE